MSFILASSSAARRTLLTQVGLSFRSVPCPDAEEERLKGELLGTSPAALAEALAAGKARYVSAQMPGEFTLGADQVCELEGVRLSKQTERAAAAAQLMRLQGKTHFLHSAFAWARDGHTLLRRTVSVRMVMKSLTEAEIEAYLDRDRPYASAGSYCYELTGKDLFLSADGSVDAIMGMPLAEATETLKALLA